jgi:hypothetical protein
MKLQSLNLDYLKGILDTYISLYDQHQRSVPADLRYEIQEGVLKPIGGEEPAKNAVKITFTWVIAGEQVLVDSETNSHETRGESLETDYFTILLGEDIIKLEGYVNDVLDKVTA